MTEWDDTDKYEEEFNMDLEMGDDMTIDFHSWLQELVDKQLYLMGNIERLNEILSSDNVQFLRAFRQYLKLYNSDAVSPENMIESISDDKLRGILIGIGLMLLCDADSENTTWAACDYYEQIKAVLYERTGCIK